MKSEREALIKSFPLYYKIKMGVGMFNGIYINVYAEFFIEIFYYCFTKLKHFHDAEDCSQEVFLVLWEKCTKIDFEDNIRGWLYAAADRIIQNFKFKNAKHLYDKPLDEISDVIIAENPFENLNSEADVDKALDSLNPVDQKLIINHYLYGKTSVELASEFHISPEAMRQRIGRARNRLAENLKSEIVG